MKADAKQTVNWQTLKLSVKNCPGVREPQRWSDFRVSKKSAAANLSALKTSADSNPLCLECGLCCNGVIFANGQLQPGDDAARLRELGLKLLGNPKSEIGNRKFAQPCAAFDGCRCQIYAERPQYCRAFECALLKKFKAGKVTADAALRTIRLARRRADKVGKLLRELGDANEGAALSIRFRKMQRRAETGALDDESADRFGELTLAMQDLNFLLSESFYPGG